MEKQNAMTLTDLNIPEAAASKGGKREGAGRKKGTVKRDKYEKKLMIYLKKQKNG